MERGQGARKGAGPGSRHGCQALAHASGPAVVRFPVLPLTLFLLCPRRPQVGAKGEGELAHKKGCRCRRSRCVKK